MVQVLRCMMIVPILMSIGCVYGFPRNIEGDWNEGAAVWTSHVDKGRTRGEDKV